MHDKYQRYEWQMLKTSSHPGEAVHVLNIGICHNLHWNFFFTTQDITSPFGLVNPPHPYKTNAQIISAFGINITDVCILYQCLLKNMLCLHESLHEQDPLILPQSSSFLEDCHVLG